MFRFLTPAVFKTSNSDQLNHILGHELVITEKSFCRFVVLDCDHFINVGFTRQRGREAQWNGNNATRRHLWALSEWTASEGPDVWVHAPVANKVAQAHAERPISGLCAISRGSPNECERMRHGATHSGKSKTGLLANALQPQRCSMLASIGLLNADRRGGGEHQTSSP
ncbi:hypothetical protein M8818_007488 [Zalaria obscura]|uniref:Uncharacterized protein n=1 Tax=Zalaria obscura TaxID=2024903 RepID=A0ACC3S4F3_9PEZI